MSRRKTKEKILLLLEQKSWPEIAIQLEHYEVPDLVNPLFAALCSVKELCKWHGVSSFGVVVPRLCDIDSEAARIIMRRLLWSLNEESGGIGWGAPEAMAEIMVHRQILFDEYIHMLISYMHEDGADILQNGNYLELPALQHGLLWGVGRLLMHRRQAMLARDIVQPLTAYLNSPDEIVKGLACWCLGKCGQQEIIRDLHPVTKVACRFNLYLNGFLREVGVAELASDAISQLLKKIHHRDFDAGK